MPNITESQWLPEQKLLVTHISGDITRQEVEQWEESLRTALACIPDDSSFKIFVNLYGFQATDLDAHKRFRTIVPETLATYGWKVGYVDMFAEEAKSLQIRYTRGIRCTGAAHVHQDETKIGRYEAAFSSPRERFFTDPEKGRDWIDGLEM